MGFTGGYDLHLYCDKKPCPYKVEGCHRPDCFCEPTKAATFRAARNAGWKISEKTGTAICPKCSRTN